MKQKLTIATRESQLALWQAKHVKQAILSHFPNLTIELYGVTTEGDRRLDTDLTKIGGKGLFVKALEEAVLLGQADIAVHSMKDVPSAFPDSLHVPVILSREDPRDALISEDYDTLRSLPKGASIGTSSLRRQCQIKALRPDLTCQFLRGNVPTRLKKLEQGEFDAIVLAAAGLKRLRLGDRINEILPLADCLPAAGQGAIGIECRKTDSDTLAFIQPLHDETTARCLAAERAIVKRLDGGCQVPIAAHATLENETLHCQARVGWPDGTGLLHVEGHCDPSEGETLGNTLAEKLLTQGAEKILSTLRH